MKNKLIVITLILIIGLTIFAGCSLWPEKNLPYATEGLEDIEDNNEDLIVVGFSQLGSESDWRTANTKSIQDALTEENGFLLIFSNGRQKQENQIKAIRNFISQEVDYIVFAPITETGWDTVLEEAKEAGIPVIVIDRMVKVEDDSLYTAMVGSDTYLEGKNAGEWLEKYIQEKTIKQQTDKELLNPGRESVNIVVLEGTLNSTAQIGRTNGFNDIAKRNENWTILATEDGDFTKAKGKEVMVMLLQKYKDIDVVVSQNDDMTFGAIEAIHEAGLTCGVDGDITVISFDAVSEAFDMMEQGFINVDIECNPLSGPIIVDIIERLENKEPVEKQLFVEESVFEAENAAKDRVGREY